MQIRRSVGFRDYLQRGGRIRLIGDAFIVGVIIIIGEVLSKEGHYFPPGAMFAPFISDPLTVFAAAILILSYTDLNFMEFRLRQFGCSTESDLDPLAKQSRILELYKATFGNDFFVQAWRFRLIFLLLLGIAAVRWILR